MSEVKIERVLCVPQCQLGEGPFWDQESGSLVFVDFSRGYFCRYYQATNRFQRLKLEATTPHSNEVTFIIPVEGEPELFVVSAGQAVGLIRWRVSDPDEHSTSLCILATVDQDKPRNRFNDGKCDFKGQLWAGTLGQSQPGVNAPNQGKLYCFSSAMKATEKVDQISLSNGLAWSPDRTKFYYNDTLIFSVDAFDYDEATDAIKNRRKLIDYKAAGLDVDHPDGMTVDTEDNLWVVNYFGSKILVIDGKTGNQVRVVKLPVDNPTSLCWAGPDYDELYLTSSRDDLSQDQLDRTPDNGGLYHITGLGAKGLPPNKVKLDKQLIDRMK